MTIEPGEVIAVLAAATLLALEGLISQVILRLASEFIKSHSVDTQFLAVEGLISQVMLLLSQCSRYNDLLRGNALHLS